MRSELIQLLVRLVPVHITVAVISSMLAGVSTVALFVFTFSVARGGGLGDVRDPLIFGALAAIFIASRFLSAAVMARGGCFLTAGLRETLINGILRTPYRRLEMIGAPRLLTAVSADVQTIANATPIMVNAATNLAVVLGLLVYIAWLSSIGVGAILMSAAVGLPIYWRLAGRASALSYEAAKTGERLNNNLDGLVSGIKQLKLNHSRTEQYLSADIARTQDEFFKARTRAVSAMSLATNIAQSIFLIMLGSLLFLERNSVAPSVGVEFFFGAIYLMGPLDASIGAISSLVVINNVFKRYRELGMQLSSSPMRDDGDRAENSDVSSWMQVVLQGVTYTYEDLQTFAFGPVDLLLKRGEIIFVKGGNGSGKTTFAKLLAGIYEPTAGMVCLDGLKSGAANGQSVRERFCCVFEDSHIFEAVWTTEGARTNENDVRALIREWSLDRSVDVRDGRFTNTRALSRGQRKKLLLISATIEDREAYVFDEWAADQDALSRKKFYLEYLPRLKRAAKLVVVLTHDDEFDSVADRIIRFGDGKLVMDSGESMKAKGGSIAKSVW